MPFPSPPWHLRGQLWLSLFPVRSGTTDHRSGLYAAAFVDYQPGGTLTYRELLVARVSRAGGVPRLTVTQMWVDSSVSRDGGRSLWALPKELAELHVTDRRLGPLARTSCDAAVGEALVAAARFASAPGAALRTPFAAGLDQRDADRRVVTGVSGSARTLPALATWDFGADGPLAWLQGHRPALSLRLTDFRLVVGG